MTKADKFINPFTDFGFKKLFQVADMANLSKEERQDYITSLKYYRDMKNVTDTAFQDGELKGKIKGKIEGKIEVARILKAQGISFEIIATSTGLTIAEIEQL